MVQIQPKRDWTCPNNRPLLYSARIHVRFLTNIQSIGLTLNLFNLCWLNINAQINLLLAITWIIIKLTLNKIINYLIKRDYKYKFPLNLQERAWSSNNDEYITSSNIIIIIIIIKIIMLIIKLRYNSKTLCMILTRLITKPSMSLSIKDQSFSPNMILTWYWYDIRKHRKHPKHDTRKQ